MSFSNIVLKRLGIPKNKDHVKDSAKI